MDACNTFDDADQVRPASYSNAILEGEIVHAAIPAMSLLVLEMT
jgi:alpha-L-arabinofuranosidase